MCTKSYVYFGSYEKEIWSFLESVISWRLFLLTLLFCGGAYSRPGRVQSVHTYFKYTHIILTNAITSENYSVCLWDNSPAYSFSSYIRTFPTMVDPAYSLPPCHTSSSSTQLIFSIKPAEQKWRKLQNLDIFIINLPQLGDLSFGGSLFLRALRGGGK